jgi:ABC-type bacteriocin/lantibiotic exporter with double-glycine peptidase domain
MVWSALDSALISEFVKTLPEGLATNIGGSNLKVSGGQAQRICLARALYSNPKIIILDEATSALDSMTENTISKEMYKLKSKATIIFIAHRLSTVKNADKIIYIENGNIKAIGTFTEVRNNIPNFDSQARLMGI